LGPLLLVHRGAACMHVLLAASMSAMHLKLILVKPYQYCITTIQYRALCQHSRMHGLGEPHVLLQEHSTHLVYSDEPSAAPQDR
jgi:hypothetical protein